MPKQLSGEIIFNTDGSVAYQPVTGFDGNGNPIFGKAIALVYARGMATSAGATDTTGVNMTAVLQDMDLHNGTSGTYELFFTGKIDGTNVIAQPYQVPQLAWWMSVYNLAYLAFTAINLIMIVHTVIAIGSSLPALFSALQTGGAAIINSVKTGLSKAFARILRVNI